MNDNPQLLYDDQSFIREKQNALYTLMFIISNGTKLHFICHCILVFLEDIQLIYFVFNNKSVISMNENLRKLISYLALDNIEFRDFRYIIYALEILYLIGAAILIVYLLFIYSEKYKENYAIKYLRFHAVLFNSVLFPIFTHALLKILIPTKNQTFAAFPEISYLHGDFFLVILTLVTAPFYLIIQFLYLPFVYINPTPFKKNNSLCQSYSYIGLKYNVAVFLLILITQFCRTYVDYISNYIFIALFLYILYASSELLSRQPYYNKHVNNFRAGMWIMILGMTIIDLFALLFGNGKSFFSILAIIIGVCCFFLGNFLNRYRYKKHINEIYMRFKAKKMEDKNIYNRENGIESSSNKSSENESYSSEDENNEEKLISVDSYSSSENNNNNKSKKNKKKAEESEESEEESGSEEYDSDSDVNSVVISDRISERITSFSTIQETVHSYVLNEPVIIFKDISDFELACRFLWNNETREAFQLMRELYKEGQNLFSKNPYLNTYYSYYLLYINERVSKEDKEYILDLNKNNDNYNDYEDEGESGSGIGSESGSGSGSENEREHYKKQEEDDDDEDNEDEIMDEDTLNRDNPDFLLSKALASKLNYLGRYFVRYLIFEIKEKKKEEKDYYKKEAREILEHMQHDAVEKHITILDLLKKFFTNIKFANKHNSKSENFDMDKYLEAIFELKKNTLSLYHDIITKYPDEKSTYQLYTLFMTEVMNQTETDKYMLAEGDSYMALNMPDSKKMDGASNAGGSSVGDSESKKRKMLKTNMINSFTNKSKKISKLVIFMFASIIILYTGVMIYGFIHINNFNNSIRDIEVLQDMNYNVHNLLSRTRMLTGVLTQSGEDIINDRLPVLLSYIDNIENKYIPILKKYSLTPASEKPVVVYNTDGQRSEYVHYNGYELVKNIVVWGRGIFNVPAKEFIARTERGENILEDYRIKMFAENFQYYYSNIIEDTMNTIYEDEIASKNAQMYLIYGMTGVLVVLSLLINIFGITPLYKNSRSLFNKTLRMFKFLMKGSLNDIISKFEISIESITDTYDISFDNKKNKVGNIENQSIVHRNYRKLRGLIINILLITSVILLTIPIIFQDKSIIKNLNYNLQVGKRKDMVIFTSIFSYEVLLQDNNFYVPGYAETLLNYEINKLETLQNKIYKGELGLKSTTEMRNLDELLITRKCREASCDDIAENIEIGWSKNMAIIYYNESLDEFIEKIKAILSLSRIKKYKVPEHMYGKIENFVSLIFTAFAEPNFAYELSSVQILFDGLERFDAILYNDLFNSIRVTLLYLIIIIFIGIFFISISAVITYKMIKSTNEILNELVNMIFIIPTSTINMIPQFKRFVETGSFEED